MKQLWINGQVLLDDEGQVFEAERIEYGDDVITGYTGNTEVFCLRGLNPENVYEIRDQDGNVILPTPPRSTHKSILTAVNPNKVRPATIKREWNGKDYSFDCFVSQTVKDEYALGKIALGDYVLVHFDDIGEQCVTSKVFKSW